MDYLAALGTFVRVADAGSFAGVADAVGLTPAMVGRQVRWLEDRLGAQLIVRTTRRQSLTEAGRQFLAHARAVLDEVQAAEETVAQLRAVPRGRLRIDAPVIFGTAMLAPVLPRFLARHPDVQVELTLNNRLVDLIDEGYDAVVRTGDLPDSGLIARRLADYRLIACASPAYLARRGVPARPEDLAAHACLGFRPGSAQLAWTFLQPGGGACTVPVSGPLVSNNGDVLREAAVAGAGIILQGTALVQADLDAGRLVPVLPDHPPRPLPVHLLYAASRAVPPKLRAFLDFMAETLGPGG